MDKFVIESNRAGGQMMFEGIFILKGELKKLLLWEEINA